MASMAIFCTVSNAASIGRSSNTQHDINAAVDRVQKSFTPEKPSTTKAPPLDENRIPDADAAGEQSATVGDELKVEESVMRQHKMFGGYFGGGGGGPYIPQPMLSAAYHPAPPFYQQNFYDDYNQIADSNDDDDDGMMMSRANRRKPASSQQNSPIFYIRLPPTPYMFVPGMGYISQPPTIQPIAAQFAAPPPPPQLHRVPMNPFINVPVSFLSNGKPTNIYQWAGAPQGASSNAIGGSGHGAYGPPPPPPQYPSYRPHRPTGGYRPQNHPKPSYLQDSKIHHLKGPYVFNGRPEEVFVLPNSPYSMPFNPQYTNEYGNSPAPASYGNYPIGYTTPYNSAFGQTFADPIQSYY